jgi:hypothetical protein
VHRRRNALLGVVVVVALVAVAVAGILLTSPRATTPTAALGAPRFIDETAAAGLDHTYDGGPTFAVGGGIATFDCSDDGKPDVFLAGGSNPAALYRNDSPAGGALKLTHLVDPATDLADVIGAYPIDIDGDGQVDLVVLRAGETVVLRGLGDCRFERGNERWSFDAGKADTTAFSATWEGSAGLPTLALGRYLTLDPSTNAASCADNALLRPDPAGSAYGPPIVLSPGYCSLSILFSDWDRSGRRDLRVTNDREYYTDGQDQLWRIAPGEAPRLYTAADGWVSMQIWGMGIASNDVTGDGYPEVYLTSQGDNRFQTLTAGPAQPTYRDIALKRGVTAAQPFTGGDTLPSTSWHPEFRDVNNDGFVDLFVSKGNVSAMPDYAEKDPSELLLGQPDGTFVQGADAAGIVTFDRGRGAAVADLNADGLPDLVEVFYGAPVRAWRNVGTGDATRPAAMGNWLGVRLSEAGPNRDAVGAWIEVKVGDLTIRREVTIGGGHIGGQLGPILVGLGPSPEAQVRVQWPDGEMGPWMRVAANQYVDIERGAAEARPSSPAGD